MSFYSENFEFDGIKNTEMGVVLVSFDKEILMEYGIPYKETLQTDVSKNNYFFYQGANEIETITLNIALVDTSGKPIKWDLESRLNIIDWMVRKEFCSFVSEDDKSIIYYLKCVEYTKKFNSSGEGVIEFVMQPDSSYAYTPIVEHIHHIENNKNIYINSLDNVNDKYYPKLEIIHLGEDLGNVVIRNKSTAQDPFIVENLKLNERIEIDFLLKSVKSSAETFKLKDVNRKWIYFKRGMNHIEIEGDCDIKFTVQYPLKV